ncbi:Serine/threonine-protein kinase 25 [Chytridiales sp. JEL 0842]|nr:Serine/threonine-protein kinase 25 [Chytridiales sp. JEL 0842]
MDFEKTERIGRGSFGEVYKGIKKSTKEVVAIKVLDLDTDDDDILDVQKEITVLSHCESEHITRYHGSYLVGTKLWVVMDFAAGGSLRSILKSGPIEERHIAIIIREVLSALVYLHKSVKIIHRDIKAANILLTDEGKVKLCDFGVAGQITMNCARRHSFVGTPYWMAPEIIMRSQYDFKADIWSLGITVIELATGNPPFADQDPRRAIFLIPRSRPPQLEGNFSPLIKEFISLCLIEEPEQRPSAEDLLKSRFIRNASRGTADLKEILTRHEAWKLTSPDYHPEGQFGDGDANDDSDPEFENDDDWIFETLKSNASFRRGSTADELTATIRSSRSLRLSSHVGEKLSGTGDEENMNTVKSSRFAPHQIGQPQAKADAVQQDASSGVPSVVANTAPIVPSSFNTWMRQQTRQSPVVKSHETRAIESHRKTHSKSGSISGIQMTDLQSLAALQQQQQQHQQQQQTQQQNYHHRGSPSSNNSQTPTPFQRTPSNPSVPTSNNPLIQTSQSKTPSTPPKRPNDLTPTTTPPRYPASRSANGQLGPPTPFRVVSAPATPTPIPNASGGTSSNAMLGTFSPPRNQRGMYTIRGRNWGPTRKYAGRSVSAQLDRVGQVQGGLGESGQIGDVVAQAPVLMDDSVKPIDLSKLLDVKELEKEMGFRLLETRRLLESLELAFDASAA